MTIDKQTPLLEKHFAYRHQADKMDTVKLGRYQPFLKILQYFLYLQPAL